MEVNVGDIIETQVGGPYTVIKIEDGLITFKMKNGIGMTITTHITKIIKRTQAL